MFNSMAPSSSVYVVILGSPRPLSPRTSNFSDVSGFRLGSSWLLGITALLFFGASRFIIGTAPVVGVGRTAGLTVYLG